MIRRARVTLASSDSHILWVGLSRGSEVPTPKDPGWELVSFAVVTTNDGCGDYRAREVQCVFLWRKKREVAPYRSPAAPESEPG